MVGDDRDNPIAFGYEYEARKVLSLLRQYERDNAALRGEVEVMRAALEAE